jgi:hypothetical protein
LNKFTQEREEKTLIIIKIMEEIDKEIEMKEEKAILFKI